MNQRMTKERFGALITALMRGIDEMEFELENSDPEKSEDYGAQEYQIQLANEALSILLRRRIKA
jgi:hypothetical protein